jgi:glycine dehydrogenase
VFNSYHTEHEMLRYLKRLQNKDLALDHSMISLGSCTMKLNATSEMIPVTWPEFADMHPFAPIDQAQGYMEMIGGLERRCGRSPASMPSACSPTPVRRANTPASWRSCATTRAAARAAQHLPDSALGARHQSGHARRCAACRSSSSIATTAATSISPTSRPKPRSTPRSSACLMITYPSTHGVFEEAIKDICAIIHAHGGQVYMDGANLNAQVGLTSPGLIGADVSHMNLHKTFAIPHGGGGPGHGPDRRQGASRALHGQPCRAADRRPGRLNRDRAPFQPRPGARRPSCRSRGCTSPCSAARA